MGGLIAFFKTFGLISKDNKGLLLAMGAMVAGTQYVMGEVHKKHDIAMVRIKGNQTQVHTMVVQQAQIVVALKNLNESIKDVKKSVDITKARVWKLATDRSQ